MYRLSVCGGTDASIRSKVRSRYSDIQQPLLDSDGRPCLLVAITPYQKVVCYL